jgi:hypothetical protein
MSARRARAPEAVVARRLEEEARLWRVLRTATRRITLLDQRRRESELQRNRQLTALEARLAAFAERERRLDESGWSDVELPRRMIAFASGCLQLGQELAADVYVSHDDLPMLAATMLRERHGGRIMYDAIEPRDRGSRALRRDYLGDFLRAYDLGVLHEAEAIMAAGDTIEAHLESLGFASVDEGRRVTILGIRDVCNDGHCAEIANTLLGLGRQVTIVGPLAPESPNPAVIYRTVVHEPQPY